MSSPKRLEALLFDQRTVTRTDFRGNEIRNHPKTEYKPKAPPCTPIHEPLKHNHTLVPVRNRIPFDLYIHGNTILHHDPREPVAIQTKPIDEEREMAQNTRPRIVMTPAVSIDDIQEPERAILVKDMYQSDTTRNLEETVCDIVTFNVTSPLPGLPAPAKPLALPRLRVPKVPPAWRKECVTWDNIQLRSYCDDQKEFWSRHPASRCPGCQQTALAKLQEDRNRSIRTGK